MTAAAFEALEARIVALERQIAGPTVDRPLSVADTCAALGVSLRSFYRVLPELRRAGLVEFAPYGNRRKFSALSVERVRRRGVRG